MNADELIAAANEAAAEGERAVADACDLAALAEVERAYVKGTLADIKKSIKEVDSADRARVGQALTAAERRVRAAIEVRRVDIAKSDREAAAPIASTSPRWARRTNAATSTRSRRPGASWKTSSSGSVTRCITAMRSRTTGTTSRRSTSRPIIRRAPCRTRSMPISASPSK